MSPPRAGSRSQPKNSLSNVCIIASGVICPSSAFCVVCGQTVRVKSAVCGIAGSVSASGRLAIVASTKRFGSASQCAAPELVTVTWAESLLKATFGSPARKIGEPAPGRFRIGALREDRVGAVAEIGPAVAVRPARHGDRGDAVAERRGELVRGADMVDRHRRAAGFHVVDRLQEAVGRRRGREEVVLGVELDEPAIGGERSGRGQAALREPARRRRGRRCPNGHARRRRRAGRSPSDCRRCSLPRRRGTSRNRSASAGSSAQASPAGHRDRARRTAPAGNSACRPAPCAGARDRRRCRSGLARRRSICRAARARPSRAGAAGW